MQGKPNTACMEHVRFVHVLAWRFAKVSNNAETATFLRQITSDVMSHAQIPAVQWFWGMHGLVLETSIWLLAESTRSQLCDARLAQKSWDFAFIPAHSSIWWSCVVFLIVWFFERLGTKKTPEISNFAPKSIGATLVFSWPLLLAEVSFEMRRQSSTDF